MNLHRTHNAPFQWVSASDSVIRVLKPEPMTIKVRGQVETLDLTKLSLRVAQKEQKRRTHSSACNFNVFRDLANNLLHSELTRSSIAAIKDGRSPILMGLLLFRGSSFLSVSIWFRLCVRQRMTWIRSPNFKLFHDLSAV